MPAQSDVLLQQRMLFGFQSGKYDVAELKVNLSFCKETHGGGFKQKMFSHVSKRKVIIIELLPRQQFIEASLSAAEFLERKSFDKCSRNVWFPSSFHRESTLSIRCVKGRERTCLDNYRKLWLLIIPTRCQRFLRTSKSLDWIALTTASMTESWDCSRHFA